MLFAFPSVIISFPLLLNMYVHTYVCIRLYFCLFLSFFSLAAIITTMITTMMIRKGKREKDRKGKERKGKGWKWRYEGFVCYYVCMYITIFFLNFFLSLSSHSSLFAFSPPLFVFAQLSSSLITPAIPHHLRSLPSRMISIHTYIHKKILQSYPT